MKAKYILTNPLDETETFVFRSRKQALAVAYQVSVFLSLVTTIERKPTYKSGIGKILVYANGNWRRI